MDINCLRVMNSLHKLGVTEQEFKDIAEEVSHTERSGFSIKAVKNGKVIGIDHDNKHNIVIKNAGDFSKVESSGDLSGLELKPNTRILMKTLVNFDDLPEQIYTLHGIARYRASDSMIKSIANNLEELKQRICERFADGYSKQLAEEHYWEEYGGYDEAKREEGRLKKELIRQEQLKAVYWLFGEKYDFKYSETRTNIAKIIKVFSAKNVRLAIIQLNEEFEKGNFMGYCAREVCKGVEVRIQAYKPSDSRYNYVCEGREIYRQDGKELWICDDGLLGNIDVAELNILINRTGNHILTKEVYEREKDSTRVEILTAKRKSLEEKGKKKLAEKIQQQFRKKGEVCRQGVTIKPNSIEYNGTVIKGDMVNDYITVQELPFRETLEFRNILAGYVDFVLEREKEYDTYHDNNRIEVNLKEKRSFSVGSIDIMVEKRNNSFFVNCVKIRKDELHQIIMLALNHTDRQKYLDWLKGVGRESLRLKNAIKNGITFRFVVDKSDDNCLVEAGGKFTFNLPIKRENGKTFVVIDGKDYKVKDITALFDLQKDVGRSYHYNNSLMQRGIKLLYQGIKDITPREIGKIIKSAKIEYSRKIRKSIAFIENAVRLAKAQSVNGGWVVRGDSGKQYFVGKDMSIYTVKNGEKDQYLCILDDNYIDQDDEAQVNDAVAKRLLVLRHDKTTAKGIWEQGDKVDKIWKEIADETNQ